MRAAGLYAISSKNYKAKQEKSEIKETKNLLLEPSNRATAINQVWHSDITYVPTDEGWLYLAGRAWTAFQKGLWDMQKSLQQQVASGHS